MNTNYSYRNESCHSHPHFGNLLFIPLFLFAMYYSRFHFMWPIFAIFFIFFILVGPRRRYYQERRIQKNNQIANSDIGITQKITHNSKYCKNCGTALDPDSKFCSECGQNIF